MWYAFREKNNRLKKKKNGEYTLRKKTRLLKRRCVSTLLGKKTDEKERR